MEYEGTIGLVIRIKEKILKMMKNESFGCKFHPRTLLTTFFIYIEVQEPKKYSEF
jgi:hypothetical protein